MTAQEGESHGNDLADFIKSEVISDAMETTEEKIPEESKAEIDAAEDIDANIETSFDIDSELDDNDAESIKSAPDSEEVAGQSIEANDEISGETDEEIGEESSSEARAAASEDIGDELADELVEESTVDRFDHVAGEDRLGEIPQSEVEGGSGLSETQSFSVKPEKTWTVYPELENAALVDEDFLAEYYNEPDFSLSTFEQLEKMNTELSLESSYLLPPALNSLETSADLNLVSEMADGAESPDPSIESLDESEPPQSELISDLDADEDEAEEEVEPVKTRESEIASIRSETEASIIAAIEEYKEALVSAITNRKEEFANIKQTFSLKHAEAQASYQDNIERLQLEVEQSKQAAKEKYSANKARLKNQLKQAMDANKKMHQLVVDKSKSQLSENNKRDTEETKSIGKEALARKTAALEKGASTYAENLERFRTEFFAKKKAAQTEYESAKSEKKSTQASIAKLEAAKEELKSKISAAKSQRDSVKRKAQNVYATEIEDLKAKLIAKKRQNATTAKKNVEVSQQQKKDKNKKAMASYNLSIERIKKDYLIEIMAGKKRLALETRDYKKEFSAEKKKLNEQRYEKYAQAKKSAERKIDDAKKSMWASHAELLQKQVQQISRVNENYNRVPASIKNNQFY